MTRKPPIRKQGAKRTEIPLPDGVTVLLSTSQTAKALGFSGRTSVYRLVKSGDLTPIKVLGSVRFRAEEVARLQGGCAA